ALADQPKEAGSQHMLCRAPSPPNLAASTAPPVEKTTGTTMKAETCVQGKGSGSSPGVEGGGGGDGACSVNLGDEACHADMLPTCPPQPSSRHRPPISHGARHSTSGARDDEVTLSVSLSCSPLDYASLLPCAET
ncbi:MAG: hypothetical protein SGPRY_009498, partial [Prymnesium sp.]